MTAIARAMGRTNGSISGKSMRLGLQFHGGRSRELARNHPAARTGRTLFHNKVEDAQRHFGVLKPGLWQRKLGGKVVKGSWKSWPIFALTLEERATCPRDCKLWLGCYGNNMGRAVRYRPGRQLEDVIAFDLALLQKNHPAGFVVRLHILGDFYSVAYVDFWADRLDEFPALHVFGYTARQLDDVIGERVAALRDYAWDRFAVRTSGAPDGPRTSVFEPGEAPAGAIVCPAQTGRTTNCATCGLCWATAAMPKPIAFMRH